MSQDGKKKKRKKLLKAHEAFAGTKVCQVKILGAKPALCVTLRGKQGGVLGSDTPRRTGSDCTSLSKDGTEPPGTKGFQQPGSTGPKQPHILWGAPFSSSFYPSGGDLFIQGKSQPETPVLRHMDSTHYLRQNIQHVRKKGNKTKLSQITSASSAPLFSFFTL